jgi:hypothetical protein
MKLGWFWAALSFSLLLVCQDVWSRTEFFQLQDLRPGMKGIGKTCFRGSKPEEFQVEILGVLRGVSPGANAILARLSGSLIEQTGVFEGMSGSPVFIDGKLLGAVAFSFPFSKEAIGGITPITEMVDAFVERGVVGTAGAKTILKKSMLWDYQLQPLDTYKSNPLLPLTIGNMAPQPTSIPAGGHALMPISTPLSLAGFSEPTLKMFSPQLRAFGLSCLQGTGSSALQAGAQTKNSAVPADSSPLEPGSNIVVPLVRGDLDASAGGTVTFVDGNKIYAFGHMFFNLGFTELPMHKGRAITVFPSLQSSFKILETGDPIGSVRQDRISGIYGILGQKTRMVPLHFHITTSRGTKKDLNFEIARDRFLTPFLVNLTVFNSIVSFERSLGVSTVQLNGKIRIKGEDPVEIDTRFSSDSNTPAYASLSVAIPVSLLLEAGYQDIEFENIDLEVSAVEDDRTAVLESLRIDRSELKAGEAVDLDLFYKKGDGAVIQDSYPVKIPSDVSPGTLYMLVADGTSVMSMDAREQGDDLIPRNLSQLIKFINNIRKNDHLYVRLFRREPGAVIRGEGLPGLPPSILSILKSDRNAGGISPIQTSVYMEYELPPSEYVVAGSKIINLVIKP